MPSPEHGSRSFFLRALPEQGPDGITWRGYVAALPNGPERYFEHLEQIPEIVLDLLSGRSTEHEGVG